MSNIEIATVGDNCIDRFLPPVGVSMVGGNAVNVAVHLSRLGHRVGYFGAVGTDRDGERMLACLAENGVVTDHVRVVAGGTAFTDIGSDANGERVMLFEDFGVCRGYRPFPREVERLCSLRHVHIGWLDDGGWLKRRLAAAGVSVSQDLSVNADPADIGAASLAIGFASETGPADAAERLLERMLRDGARIAVVTRGPAGSIAGSGAERAQTDAAPTQVIDTTGAGDTFIAGLISSHLKGRDLRACLEAARNAAAATCTHFGGFPQVPLPLAR
jgi:fructoselysine 6-kinase